MYLCSTILLPVEEIGASSKSPSLPVGEEIEKVPRERERKMESLTSHLSSLEGFTTLFYYFRVSLCELYIAYTSESTGAVRRASEQREGSLVPEHESSKAHNSM